jgi:transcription antitermination factor NusG
MNDQHWYAIRVRKDTEQVASSALRARGIEEFLPLERTRRKWSDRVKTVDRPLFPGYVFCRVSFSSSARILPLQGAVGFVRFGSAPEPIPDVEIHAVKRLVDSECRLKPMALVHEGQRVMLTAGPFAGLEGILLNIRDSRHFVVNLTILQRSLAVAVDGECAPAAGDRWSQDGAAQARRAGT